MATQIKYNVVKSAQYKRDVKAAKKSGLDMEKLELVIAVLQADGTLPPKSRDHALKGEWVGARECHIAPNWLLVYKKIKEELKLMLLRTGSHAKLELE